MNLQAIVSFAVADSTILIVLGWVVRELLRWRRLTDQHNMMWAEFASAHGIPFDPDSGNGMVRAAKLGR